MTMQWTVVHFYNDNSVEPVPSYWVNEEGTSCVWPNNSGNANKLRMSRAKPNIFDFTSYSCRILSKNIGKLDILFNIIIYNNIKVTNN